MRIWKAIKLAYLRWSLTREEDWLIELEINGIHSGPEYGECKYWIAIFTADIKQLEGKK